MELSREAHHYISKIQIVKRIIKMSNTTNTPINQPMLSCSVTKLSVSECDCVTTP